METNTFPTIRKSIPSEFQNLAIPEFCHNDAGQLSITGTKCLC